MKHMKVTKPCKSIYNSSGPTQSITVKDNIQEINNYNCLTIRML